MSKIGSKPVNIPEGVTIEVKDDVVEVKGKNGVLTVPVLSGVTMEIKDGEMSFETSKKTKQALSNWGTMRSLVQNAVLGSMENFSKELIVEGVGYRANVEGKDLVLGLGFSHPVKFSIPDGIEISVEKNSIKISGKDKAQVGETAAKIRSFRKPEPYKGKGIRYSDETVKIKAGKKAVGSEG